MITMGMSYYALDDAGRRKGLGLPRIDKQFICGERKRLGDQRIDCLIQRHQRSEGCWAIAERSGRKWV